MVYKKSTLFSVEETLHANDPLYALMDFKLSRLTTKALVVNTTKVFIRIIRIL